MERYFTVTYKERASCKSIERIAIVVILAPDYEIRGQAPAGIRKSLILKNIGYPIKTSGITNKDFCKKLEEC